MVEASAREVQARRDVIRFQVRKLVEHLRARQPRGQEVENVGDTNAEAAHARASSTLRRVYGDAIGDEGHGVVQNTPGADGDGCAPRPAGGWQATAV